MSIGNIVQVIGAVVDVEFPKEAIPSVYDALTLKEGDLVFEVQQQLGAKHVLCLDLQTILAHLDQCHWNRLKFVYSFHPFLHSIRTTFAKFVKMFFHGETIDQPQLLQHVPLVQPIAQSPNSFLQKANLHTRA